MRPLLLLLLQKSRSILCGNFHFFRLAHTHTLQQQRHTFALLLPTTSSASLSHKHKHAVDFCLCRVAGGGGREKRQPSLSICDILLLLQLNGVANFLLFSCTLHCLAAQHKFLLCVCLCVKQTFLADTFFRLAQHFSQQRFCSFTLCVLPFQQKQFVYAVKLANCCKILNKFYTFHRHALTMPGMENIDRFLLSMRICICRPANLI